MKIPIPDKIQTDNGMVVILPYASRDKFMKGLVEGWKAAMQRMYEVINYEEIEFIEIGEE